MTDSETLDKARALFTGATQGVLLAQPLASCTGATFRHV